MKAPDCPECGSQLTRHAPRKQLFDCPNGHGPFHRTIARSVRPKVQAGKRHQCVWCRKKRDEKYMQLERHYHVLMWVCVRCSGHFKLIKKGKKK